MTDKKLVKFASAFRAGIIGRKVSAMRCYMICAPLVSLLSIHGVCCKLVEGEVAGEIGREFNVCNHFWIGLADGRVLDPTADQFNKYSLFPQLPKVYLGMPSTIHTNYRSPRISEQAGKGRI